MAVAAMLASFYGNLTLARVISEEGLLIEKNAFIESASKQVCREFPWLVIDVGRQIHCGQCHFWVGGPV